MLKPKKRGLLVSAILFFMLINAGCSHKETRNGMDNVPFPDKKAGDEKKEYFFHEPPEEKPIVKIISGEKVSSIEEAQGKIFHDTERQAGMKTIINSLILRDVPMGNIVEILTDLCGYNVIASKEASESKINIFLRNVTMRKAVEAICRLNGLWYREGDGVITLMTAEEYANEMVVRRNEKARAYFMRYTNAMDMAAIIQAVMGAQVKFQNISGEKPYGHVEAESSGGGGGGSSAADDTGLEEEEKAKGTVLGITGKEVDAAVLAKKIGKPLPAVITVFKRNNCIVARSLDEEILTEMSRIIEALDTPTSQVLLEIKIFQLNLSDGFDSFFKIDYTLDNRSNYSLEHRSEDYTGSGRWGAGKNFYETASSMPGAFLDSSTLQYIFSNKFINARMAIYEREGRLNMLSTPFLMSANNSEVNFFVGEETPLRDEVESKVIYDDEGNVVTTIFEVTIKREELGTDVTISSFINEDGTITMELETEISTANLNMTEIPVINEATGATAVFPLDGVNKTELESIIAVKSGQSVAIGGIIKEQDELEEKKVPILGDIPYLSFFFKELKTHKAKTETVIILTPHVIPHPAMVQKTSNEFLKRKSSHPSIFGE